MTLAQAKGLSSEALSEVEDEFERVVYCMHLVEREMSDVLAERSGVDRADHLAHDPRCLVADLDFRVKARGRR
jgi:hypothetical protein